MESRLAFRNDVTALAKKVYEVVRVPRKPFADWLEDRLPVASISSGELARAYNDTGYLRQITRDGSSDGRCTGAQHAPKKEIAKYRSGLKNPGPIVAYRLGRALETCFDRRIRNTGGKVRLEEFEGANGIDALIMAKHWRHALGCIGELVGKSESIRLSWIAALEPALESRARNSSLPASLYPALDDAWKRWAHFEDPRRLPPRLAGAYYVASIGTDEATAEAIRIAQAWQPLALVS